MAPEVARGRKLEDPVAEDWRPDLRGNKHEIEEYLEQQGGYDLFDYLLKDLMAKQPADPLQHMLDCLEKGYPTGPLKVIVSSPPGLGRETLARKLAEHFDLVYIGAGELLREADVDMQKLAYAKDEEVAQLVMELVKQAEKKMQGFVLDGFPRTCCQTTFLKEKAVVPTHLLVLKASESFILERQQRIADGSVQGTYVAPEVLSEKLRAHACHNALALQAYTDRATLIDYEAEISDAEVFSKMEKAVRMRPRSKGPAPPPRVVIVGPRGTGAPEYASRLAARLGAVCVNGKELLAPAKPKAGSSVVSPSLERLAKQDPLGVVGARLRQVDCARQGWVLANFPLSSEQANLLSKDPKLAPIRVVALTASAEACVQRLRHVLTDPVTEQVWTVVPQNATIRSRLQRNPDHQPDAVQAAYKEYAQEIAGVLKALGGEGASSRCLELPAEGSPEAVFNELVEFVERPLPMPPRAG